jgi:hypothetical protein
MMSRVRHGHLIEIVQPFTDAVYQLLTSGTILAGSELEYLSEDSESTGEITSERSNFYMINENTFGEIEDANNLSKKRILKLGKNQISQIQLGNVHVVIFSFLAPSLSGLVIVFLGFKLFKEISNQPSTFLLVSKEEIRILLDKSKRFISCITS